MRRRLFAILALASAIGGCASAHLQVSIDLYDEDPRFIAPMTPEDAVQLMENVANLRQAAIDRTSQRKFLATASRNIFTTTWNQAGGSSKVAEEVEIGYQGFIAGADVALASLEPKLDSANASIAQYIEDYAQAYETAAAEFKRCENYRVSGRFSNGGDTTTPTECHVSELTKKVERLDQEWILRRLPVSLRTEEAKARASIANAVSAYHSFVSPTATVKVTRLSSDNEKVASLTRGPEQATGAFVIDWIGLRARLNLALEAAQLGGMRARESQLVLAIQSLNTGMASLAATSGLIPKDSGASEAAASPRKSQSDLLDSSIKIALELDSLRNDLPDNASAQTALAGLARNSSEFTELIDRLQDTGNPVWRIITDPSNEEHWNKSPASTNFYAEGKSSVVLVRNDPMRFDVHDATNNPTALIKGQLEVSRAVANAAISVASASAGLPAVKSTGGTKSADTSTSSSTDSATATAFATRKATADEAARLRDREIRGLELELSASLAGLNAGSDIVPAAQINRLAALLNAYKTMFDASAKSSP